MKAWTSDWRWSFVTISIKRNKSQVDLCHIFLALPHDGHTLCKYKEQTEEISFAIFCWSNGEKPPSLQGMGDIKIIWMRVSCVKKSQYSTFHNTAFKLVFIHFSCQIRIILNVCGCVCVCVTEVGSSGSGTPVLTHNLHTCILYFVPCVRDNKQTHSRSSSWRGCSWGAAAEAEAVGKQQMKQTQSGCSLVWPCENGAYQRHYHTRLLVHQSMGLCQQIFHLEFPENGQRQPATLSYS